MSSTGVTWANLFTRSLTGCTRLENLSRARVTQILNLRLLAPDIQEALLRLPPLHEAMIHLFYEKCNRSLLKQIGRSKGASGENSIVDSNAAKHKSTREPTMRPAGAQVSSIYRDWTLVQRKFTVRSLQLQRRIAGCCQRGTHRSR